MSDHHSALTTRRLLDSTNTLLKEQKLVADKREKFNVFSILNVESHENATHSAFIGELLNPYGSHCMGYQFLELFLEGIGDTALVTATTEVHLEKYVGPITIDKDNPLRSTGGRIDLCLKDGIGNSIAIENKIYARDQRLQLIRYRNYNFTKNQVFYLTLHGGGPDEETQQLIDTNEEYQYSAISYKQHIVNWLDKCYAAATAQPILSATIKQYNLLLKNITGTMDNQYQEELTQLILSNFEAAKTIEENVTVAHHKVCRSMLRLVLKRLKEHYLREGQFTVSSSPEEDMGRKNVQIYVQPKLSENFHNNYFVIESFSGNGRLFVGIMNEPPHDSKFATHFNNRLSRGNWVINESKLSPYEGTEVNFSNKHTIQRIYTDDSFKHGLVEHIVKEATEYIEVEYPRLEEFIRTGKLPD